MKVFAIITLAVSAVAAQSCVLKCVSGPRGGDDRTSACQNVGVTCTQPSGLACKLGLPSATPPSQCTFCTCQPPSGI
ncbi:hypothetical protein PspLS_09665 [Pyricularia sp. CBS 133598]|nr:hypothetical protein PspLS_09665 [Pyricularia sp. CBS 133598]